MAEIDRDEIARRLMNVADQSSAVSLATRAAVRAAPFSLSHESRTDRERLCSHARILFSGFREVIATEIYRRSPSAQSKDILFNASKSNIPSTLISDFPMVLLLREISSTLSENMAASTVLRTEILIDIETLEKKFHGDLWDNALWSQDFIGPKRSHWENFRSKLNQIDQTSIVWSEWYEEKQNGWSMVQPYEIEWAQLPSSLWSGCTERVIA